MMKRVERVDRVLAAGFAGAMLVTTLFAPRGASALPIRRPIDDGEPGPIIVEKQPDLRLDLFEVTDLGGDRYKLRATVRNATGTSIEAYPGGGSLVISRSKGGTTVVEPPHPQYPAIPDPVTVLKSVPLPALAPGQAMSTEVETQGRAVFTARAATVVGQDKNLANNSKLVSKLFPKTITINNFLLGIFLNPVVEQFQMHLHKTDSFVRLPNYFERYFNIPMAKKGLPWPLGDAYWYVNDINLTSTSIALADRSLAVNFNFETNGTEIIGYVEDGPDWMAPNINASPLKITVKLPLVYNATAQCFLYSTPQVIVNANWNLNNLPDFLLPDINAKISAGIKSALSETTLKQRIEFELNKQVHAQLKGGRIGSVVINPDEVQLTVETGG
jgi:hypothetical protein